MSVISNTLIFILHVKFHFAVEIVEIDLLLMVVSFYTDVYLEVPSSVPPVVLSDVMKVSDMAADIGQGVGIHIGNKSTHVL